MADHQGHQDTVPAAVNELLARAAFALDERRDEMLARCFTTDATFTLRIAGGDLIGPFEGRDGIMGLMRGAWAEQKDVRRHVVSNAFIDARADDGTLTVVSYLTLLSTANGEITLVSAGVYRDDVVAGSDGWQLRRRHLDLDRPY